jgi:hypothetical protein
VPFGGRLLWDDEAFLPRLDGIEYVVDLNAEVDVAILREFFPCRLFGCPERAGHAVLVIVDGLPLEVRDGFGFIPAEMKREADEPRP